MKRFLRISILSLIIIIPLLLTGCGGSNSGNAGAGTQSPSPAAGAAGGSQANLPEPDPDSGTFTLLVYMVGSDLESLDGAASADMKEMLAASPSDQLQILIQTGGATHWYTEGIREDLIQRYRIQNGELVHMEDAAEEQMSDPACLHAFLEWGIKAAPADRYGVILWNHGAGTLMGYGFDEYYPDECLTLADICQAFSGLDTRFAFVGFDACLMGTLETAMALSEYADYLLASEEYEPSTGWFYTDWLKALDSNRDVSIAQLGQLIVDDYVSEKNAGRYDPCTLALIDLSKVPALCEEVQNWFGSAFDRFQDVFVDSSQVRSHVKSFGGGRFEQVDLLALLEGADYEEAPETLVKAAQEAILYTSHNQSVDVAGGLALYYPYIFTDKYNGVAGNMEEVGYQDEYFKFYDSFVTTLEQGHVVRAEEEDKQDALGLVRAAGKFESSDPEMPEESDPDNADADNPARKRILHAGHLRFRRYNEVYNVPTDEKELITDLRLLQLNKTEDGYIYVGKEGGPLIAQGSSFDLSGGHYLSVGGRLVSYEPEFDSEALDLASDNRLSAPAGTEEVLSREQNAEEETKNSPAAGAVTKSLHFTEMPWDLTPDISSSAALQHSVMHHIYANDIRIADAGQNSSEENADRVRYGYVNALLNDTHYIRLLLYWDKDSPEGMVAGYREIPEEAVGMHTTVLQVPFRGLRKLKAGDKLQFYFYHFDADAQYDGIVYPEEPLVIGEEAPAVSRSLQPFLHMEPGRPLLFAGDLILLGDGSSTFAYRITDVYHNIYYIRAEDAWDPDHIIRFDTDAVLEAGIPILPEGIIWHPEEPGQPDGPDTPGGSGNSGGSNSSGSSESSASSGNAGNSAISAADSSGTNPLSALTVSELSGRLPADAEVPEEWEVLYNPLWGQILSRLAASMEGEDEAREAAEEAQEEALKAREAEEARKAAEKARQAAASQQSSGANTAANAGGVQETNTAPAPTESQTATAESSTVPEETLEDAILTDTETETEELGDAEEITLEDAIEADLEDPEETETDEETAAAETPAATQTATEAATTPATTAAAITAAAAATEAATEPEKEAATAPETAAAETEAATEPETEAATAPETAAAAETEAITEPATVPETEAPTTTKGSPFATAAPADTDTDSVVLDDFDPDSIPT